MLEKFKSSRPNMSKKELKAVRFLRLNMDIRILQADKGNCIMVLDKYKDNLNPFLESEVYESFSKDPTAKVRPRKYHSEHKTALPTQTSTSVHKPDIPLMPIASSIGSPCYIMDDFLHKILRLLAGKSESFVKNLDHFVQFLKSVNLQSVDTVVSFDDVSLLTNAPVTKVQCLISDKLHNDDTLPCRQAIMELLEVCLRTTYFQVDKFFLQKSGMAMGSYHPSLAASTGSIGS
jgi:hypothetical protein